MDTFLMGCLFAVVVIFMIATMVGIVCIVRIYKRLKWVETEICGNINHKFDGVYRDIDDKDQCVRREMESYVDSRIDKVLAKTLNTK
jgi:hypothetical protein